MGVCESCGCSSDKQSEDIYGYNEVPTESEDLEYTEDGSSGV